MPPVCLIPDAFLEHGFVCLQLALGCSKSGRDIVAARVRPSDGTFSEYMDATPQLNHRDSRHQ